MTSPTFYWLGIEEDLSLDDSFISSKGITVGHVSDHEILVGIIYQTEWNPFTLPVG